MQGSMLEWEAQQLQGDVEGVEYVRRGSTTAPGRCGGG
jgi:hypothetical protein